KRAAAIAAMILRRGLDAQPVAARGTFWIQTLHRPTGQILHFRLPHKNHSPGGGRGKREPPKRPELQKLHETGGIVRRRD
ncbi:MAG: hypothetical protein WA664_18555, partial [Candidatus Acidiferrales bacterium]